MLSINMDDVIKVLDSVKMHLIALAVVLVLGIAIMVAVRKLPKSKKFLARGETAMAMILAIAVIVNLICTGPMFTMISLATGGGTISEETSAEASALVEDIAEEGIVLLENENSALPLQSGSNLNVFGWASTNPVYGGTGSGSLNDAYHTTTLLEGLANAGFTTNEELSQFYIDYKSDRPVVSMSSQDWTLPEPNVNLYTDEMIQNAKDFSDTAMVVIGRVGGEGADLPTDMASVVDGTWNSEQSVGGDSAYFRGTYDDSLNEGNDWDEGDHFLELSNREEELLDLVCSNFDKVIVLYNGANPFELGFVEDYEQIQSVIWCAGTGQGGFNGLGNILNGTVSPSGKLIDTFVYDLTQTPTWNNFGAFYYDNMDEYLAGGSFNQNATPAFVNYVEGIYVGYKFYETAAVEGLIDYDTTVQYPFGYGLSYTSFTQEMSTITEDLESGTLSFDVTVTNTGAVAGKDVVEVYYNPPYTNGGIEKASANLVAFDKTETLEPGASETISFTIKLEDMASYDTYGEGAYVLEGGVYTISINADSHTVLDSEQYIVPETISYKDGRSSDKTPATNQFGFAEGSATYQNAVQARGEFFEDHPEARDAFSIRVIDSHTYTMCYGYPVAEGARMAAAGASVEEIAAYIQDWVDHVRVLFVPFDLKFAKKSGRVSAAAAFVGEALGLKPIMTFVDGESKILSKVRGEKNVISTIVDLCSKERQSGTPYLLVRGNNQEQSARLREACQAALGEEAALEYPIGGVVAINAGPNLVGIVYRT